MRHAVAVAAAAAGAVAGALVLAGCTGGSGGATGSSSASSVSSSATSSVSPSLSTVPPTASSSAVATGGSTPAPTASIAQPPDPVVAAGNAGAWTLTRAAPGAPVSRQVPSVQCGQDGAVTATGLTLSAGGRSLTLLDPAVTVTGTANRDAAGGTFRGRGADAAVSFTWTC